MTGNYAVALLEVTRYIEKWRWLDGCVVEITGQSTMCRIDAQIGYRQYKISVTKE